QVDPARKRHLDELRQARVAARLSLRDVAQWLGVSHVEFANYERGVGSLSEAQIEAYHELLKSRSQAQPIVDQPPPT
ncbi:helix-turn-helix transcriptional regulator, partial [Listeria monocytogenes]|uniref:helix-turn-helix transcriptional regulator n=1 Tax=Listeria monocytogenes TaxID=1639 RepID=UPI002FDC2F22